MHETSCARMLRRLSISMCLEMVSGLTNFVNTSAGVAKVRTFVICMFPVETRSCTKSCRSSICVVFLVTPRRDVIAFADDESVKFVNSVLQFSKISSIVDRTFKDSIVAMLIAYSSASQLDNATVVCVRDQKVKMAPSKYVTPPLVLRRVSLHPAQSLSMYVSIVKIYGSPPGTRVRVFGCSLNSYSTVVR